MFGRSTRSGRLGASFLAVLSASLLHGQGLLPDGGEYPIVGTLPGDQVFPSVAISSKGGYVVWQDSLLDGRGFGIAARKLTSSWSPDVTAPFIVSQTTAGGQERPQVALLNDGGAVVVWQGGEQGAHKVYARFLTAAGVFATDEIAVGGQTKGEQIDASVAVLTGGNVVVVWSVFGEDGNLQGVFGRAFSPSGVSSGAPFQINQFSLYNQRNPQVASLQGGGFVVTWISEQQRHAASETDSYASVDVYARTYGPTGVPGGDEFLVNVGRTTCANPVVSGAASGGFLVAWTQKAGTRTDGWDVYSRFYSAAGVSGAEPVRVNTFVHGDQYLPTVATIDDRELVVWTSMGQDGHREGVFAQLLRSGVAVGSEFPVNTTTASRQIHPSISADAGGHFLVVWSSYTAAHSMDLRAQRFSFTADLPIPDAPYVTALTSLSLQVSWPELLGYAVDHYELSIDGGATISVASAPYTIGSIQPSSVHQARLRYVLKTGDVSQWSPTGSGKTWGVDDNLDGLPDDWQALYFGSDPDSWPASNVDSDGDGATNAQEFRAGTNPTDATSVLRQRIVHRHNGTWLEWNTVPGAVYQVQQCESALPPWINVGAPRFAAGTSDTLLLPPDIKAAFFRITRLR